MPQVRSTTCELIVSDDGRDATLINPATGTRWIMDTATALADGHGRDLVTFGAEARRFGGNYVDATAGRAVPFTSGHAQALGDRCILVERDGPAGRLVLRYELNAEGVQVTAVLGRSTVTAFVLPGAFRPEGVAAPAVTIPVNQGIWHKGTGDPFVLHMLRTGHGGWSMPFFAVCGTRDALLTIIETEHDARIWLEKTPDGRMVAASIQDPSLGHMVYPRSVRLQFTRPDVSSVCRAYRQFVRDRGTFISWEEKLAARPALDRLFGALQCFIGYCQDETLDYAASFRSLKAMGFDRAFVYPLAIGNVLEGFKMGGRPPIDIRNHLGLLDELGYLSTSWMWTEDTAPADPAEVLLGPDGRSLFSWQIDDVKWYRACPVRQVGIANRIQDARMRGFTAAHFDVTASRNGLMCHHPDHPVDRRDDALWRTKVMDTAARRGNVISSEGFWGWAVGHYDIGSVKIPLPVHADWFTVPMTSLVYHDSCIHTWWEVDNYNNPWHRNQSERDRTHFPLSGGGWQALQAAQDALAGAPPNVMPFGAQYAYVNGRPPNTHLYRYELGMPEVKEALALALPVANLHHRIGRLDCVSHELLAADGSVQATVFADGTRVIVNYTNELREVAGTRMAPVSWRAS